VTNAKHVPGENLKGVYSSNEIHHAEQEGIQFELQVAPVEVLGTAQRWVNALKCARMQPG